jgi:hypothetical protein
VIFFLKTVFTGFTPALSEGIPWGEGWPLKICIPEKRIQSFCSILRCCEALAKRSRVWVNKMIASGLFIQSFLEQCQIPLFLILRLP